MLDVEKINEVIKDKEIEVYESEEILKINNKVLNYEETSKRVARDNSVSSQE